MKRLATLRDLLIFELAGNILVSAVDSCGGIGLEPNDALAVDTQMVGLFTARVALLEILAVGAMSSFASLAISSGPSTAQPLISGVKELLGEEFPLIISTEKNMPTSMTGFGVTVTGIAPAGTLRINDAKRGDQLLCAGLPLVGAQTLSPEARLLNAQDVERLLASAHVRTLIPVGSRGIAAEAHTLAEESGLRARLKQNTEVDLNKSAGPSSCAVFAAECNLDLDLDLPIFPIGELY